MHHEDFGGTPMDFTRFRPAKAGEVKLVSPPAGQRKRTYITACPKHLVLARAREEALARLLRGRKLPFSLPVGKIPPLEWMDHEALLALCAPYDVISFDVFDTLLVRTAGRPGNVFRLLEMQRGQLDFAQARRKAEVTARTEHQGEITLAMICDVLAREGVVSDAKEAEKAEIAAEIAMTKASPRMLQLVKALLSAGKKVVAASDMYLPGHAIEAMLQKAGYPALTKVFVSCETGACKAGGALQKYVCEQMGTDNVLHIGDNVQADVLGAAQAGIDSAWLCHQQEPDTTAAVPQSPSLPSAVWRALVNQRLNGGVGVPDAAWGVGYAVTGILTWGYCQWLHEQKRVKGWDKLFFASRDGYPMYLVYKKYFGEAEYLPVSRASAQMLDVSANAQAYVENNLLIRVGTGEPLSEALRSLGLDDCVEKWRADIDMDAPIERATLAKVQALLIRDREATESCFAPARENAAAYLRKVMAGAKHVCVADTGWKGSSVVSLRKFAEEIGLNCRIDCALLGTSKSDSVQYQEDAGYLMSYLYSPSRNKHIFRAQFRTKLHRPTALCCTLMEMLFLTDQPPLLSYAPVGEGFTYGEADPQAVQLAASQTAGLLAFAEDYHAAMSQTGFLPAVSADDAYAPFDALSRRGDLLLKVYGDYCHTAAPTARKGEGTVAEMLMQQKWISRRAYRQWIQAKG